MNEQRPMLERGRGADDSLTSSPLGRPGGLEGIADLLKDAVRQLRLSWRLFFDPRVPFWTKLIPLLGIGYIVLPVDLIPDLALGLGQLDDVAIVLLSLKLFTDLAPVELVREHLANLGARIREWRVMSEEETDFIEGEVEPDLPEVEYPDDVPPAER